MANQNGFFAVDRERFYEACDLGMKEAVSYLVLCNGTSKNNTTTCWSVNSIETYTSISRKKAKQAIENLKRYGLIEQLRGGSKPRYAVKEKHKGKLDADSVVWMPNAVVQGVSGEVPPLDRVRGTQEVMVLRLFFDLYGEQNLVDDGGLPMYINWKFGKRQKLGTYGLYNIFGFRDFSSWANSSGVWEVHCDESPPKGKTKFHLIWERWGLLRKMGLIVDVPYLFDDGAKSSGESFQPHDFDGEIVHHLDGELYGITVNASYAAMAALGANVSDCAADQIYDFDYVVPVPTDKPNASVIVTSQLRYKPKTRMTSKWFYERSKQEKIAVERYSELIKKATGQPLQTVDSASGF